MAYAPTVAPLLLWLTPSLLALLLYGLGQGFVKMWITEVSPARFCLYFASARAVVMLCYFFANPHTSVFAAEGRHVLAIGVLAYLLDGTGWIMYFQSIIAGPITIVGTLLGRLSCDHHCACALVPWRNALAAPVRRCRSSHRWLHRACL
jgi:uncharacterized membrane protein